MSPHDLGLLATAKSRLMRPSLAIRLAGVVGTRIDNLFRYLPGGTHQKITEIAQAALEKCLDVALKTLPAQAPPVAPADSADSAGSTESAGSAESAGFALSATPATSAGAAGGVSRSLTRVANRFTRLARRTPQQSKVLHKLAVIGTGAAGGAFGLLALPAELPVTTTLMFRSICSIAQSKGESLSDPEVQMQCLLVLALGGPAKADDDAQWGYFVVRSTLAQAVSRASSELAAKGIGAHSSSVLLQLMRQIASRLSVQISEQVAAKSIPALGAVFGAAINAAFIDHFQQIADAHFTVRGLERKYGALKVREQWDALPA
ncbi:EcsC family protein [Pararobbsia alpina]|nr:EcsC family protein [Pararobbsia alpina]